MRPVAGAMEKLPKLLVSLAVASFSILDQTPAIILPILMAISCAESILPCRSNLFLFLRRTPMGSVMCGGSRSRSYGFIANSVYKISKDKVNSINNSKSGYVCCRFVIAISLSLSNSGPGMALITVDINSEMVRFKYRFGTIDRRQVAFITV